MKYTKETLAALLNGREYGEEITKQEELDAKASGLVVVFGASDDLAEFRGALHDEAQCYEDTEMLIDADGVLPVWDQINTNDEDECERYFYRKNKGGKLIKAVWDSSHGFSWIYETDIPHATFEILEDGEKYCRGIVFELKELSKK